MRARIVLALAALSVASPAFATGTMSCRGRVNPEIRLDLVIGHGAGLSIVQARLIDRREIFVTGATPTSPAIGQKWLDREDLRLEIVDANHETVLARLVAVHQGPSGRYVGSLLYGGRTHAVICRSEG